jgi:hypothetical protein
MFCKCKEKDRKIKILTRNNEGLATELEKWTKVTPHEPHIVDGEYVKEYRFKTKEEYDEFIKYKNNVIAEANLYITLLEHMLDENDVKLCKEEFNALLQIKCKNQKEGE